jgi:hypothetical protein
MKIIRIAALSHSNQLRTFLSRGDKGTLVPDTNFLNALLLLDELSKFGPYTSIADINAVCSTPAYSAYSRYLNEIRKFNSILSATMTSDQSRAVNAILGKYKLGIIDYITTTTATGYGAADINRIINYIMTIYYYGGGDSFSYRTKTVQQPMFIRIYDKFKNIVADAANSSEMTQLANAITSQNALLIPDVLYENAKVGRPSAHMAESSKKIAEKIIDNKYNAATFDKVFGQNVEIIKGEIMTSSGAGDYKNISDIKKRRLEKERVSADPSKLLPGTPPPIRSIEEEDPINVEASMWVNQHALTYLCSFFLYYYKLILSFPD